MRLLWFCRKGFHPKGFGLFIRAGEWVEVVGKVKDEYVVRVLAIRTDILIHVDVFERLFDRRV